MHPVFRAIIGVTAALVVMVGCVALNVFSEGRLTGNIYIDAFMKSYFHVLVAMISFSAGVIVYRRIPRTKGEVAKVTKTSVSYHENGQVKTKGKLVDGLMDGEWATFDDQGMLIETKHYRNGKATG
jgi:hypothetical protein